MYTKVFRAMYDGTLADNWQALVTFQQLLILANDDGVVDMTIASIHRTTGIPLDILEAGIKVLEAPDHGSRTPDMEGRRISRLNDHRDWGWFLVNFSKYRQMVTRDEKKEADRQRIQAKRDAEKIPENNNVAECSELSLVVADSRSESQVSQNVADVAHTDLDLEKKKEKPQAAFEVPEWIDREAWNGYAEMRRKKRAPLTPRACAMVVKELVKLRAAGQDPAAVLDQSTRNCWTDVYPLKVQQSAGAAGKGAPSRPAPGATDLDYLMAVGK